MVVSIEAGWKIPKSHGLKFVLFLTSPQGRVPFYLPIIVTSSLSKQILLCNFKSFMILLGTLTTFWKYFPLLYC